MPFPSVFASVARRTGARRVAAATAITVAMSIPVGALTTNAQEADPQAARAAQEIQAARDRANAAAQAMFDAESTLDQLELDIAAAEEQLAATEVLADSMRASLERSAQRSFTRAGDSMPLLIDLDQANDRITEEQLAAVARGAAAFELDDYDAVMKDVRNQRSTLERQREQTAAAREQYERLKAQAEQQVVELAEIERQRLADLAVQRELERQRLAQLEKERQAQQAQAQAAAQQAASSQSSGGSTNAGSSGQSASGQPSSQPSRPQGSGSSGQSSTPTTVAPSPPPSNAGSGMICPIAGPRAFANTWGAGRSGGRSHEGVDMMSPGGTPLVAVESGYVQFKTTPLGGNSIWLNGNSGTRYFYAHLSAWEGSSRNVSQGEVIGYVGSTGNTSANHLHFEVHPGGGRAVNPYPYVRAVC